MRRRRLLATGAVLATGGCLGGAGGHAIPAALESPPDGVYLPTHGAEFAVVGVADAGDIRLALCYSYPDRFWELRGRTRYRRDADGAVHLMVLAWEPGAGVVLPELGVTVEVTREGESLFHEAVYPMVSQRLGFHYGDNVPLPRDGTYEVTVRVGATAVRRTGAFAERFGEPMAHTFRFDYARAERNALGWTRPADAGEPGALEPADVPGVPTGTAPDLPGERLPARTSDGARLVATVVSTGAERFDAAEYLAVSPRTRYNGMLLPAMGVMAHGFRDGERLFADALVRTLDPELGYHYGSAVPGLEAGDQLVLETLTPPQVARHEGYETAFLEMPPVAVGIE